MTTPGDRSRPRAALTWLLCDLVTGTRLTALPIEADDKITKRAMAVDQMTARLLLADPRCPTDWHDLLALGRTMLVVALDDTPTQAWVIEAAEYGDTAPVFTCKTLETCPERTNVPTYDQGDADDVTAAGALCAPLVTGFGFDLDLTPSTATGASGFWEGDTEDTTILDALTTLVDRDRIEWRIRLAWADPTMRRVTKTLEIARTIGQDRPHVVFDRDPYGRGTIEDHRRIHSYARGKGATILQGVGDGSGAARPMTEPLVSDLVADGWPRWEERKTLTTTRDPEAGLDDQQLLAATARLLPQREHGTVTWTLSTRDTAARPGIDYTEGDTVYLDIAPTQPLTRPDGTPGPRLDPVGGSGPVRIIGWALDTASGQADPVLWEERDDGLG